MKQISKLLFLLLALLLPAIVHAHDFEVDGIYYLKNGNEASVTYRGTSYNQYSDEYTGEVIIPGTVAFNGTTYLVTSIGSHAFYECTGLANVTIPNSVTSIGNSAFDGCSSLASITIPNSVTSIGGYAFNDCSSLASITIPNSVTSIEYRAFSSCSSLASITVASSNPKYDSRNNCNAIIETVTNTIIIGCKNTVIPNSVTSIGGDAFYSCSSLANITIPNSVTSIGNRAFSGCSSLASITIPNSVTSIGNSAFEGCSSLASITIPNSVTDIGNYTFSSCSSLASITIPNSVTSIGNYTFYSCSSLASITIPNSVTSIGYRAFSSCSSLASITIPNSVTSIGGDAFYSCSSLASITVASSNPKYDSRNNCNAIIETATNKIITGCKNTVIPNSVTIIGNRAFEGCTGLICIDIPNSVTSIGNNAFSSCSSLASITVASSNPKYDSRNNCNAIIETATNTMITGCKNTVIPNSVTIIGSCAFYDCSGLTSVTIPNSVTTIGSCAFYFCSRLSSIHIGNSVNNISLNEMADGGVDGAFVGCSSLTNISVASDNTKYDSRDNCNAIIETSTNTLIAGCKGTVIPNSVTSIGYRAFSGNLGLININIPNSVTHIGIEAFCGCTELTSINCLATTPPTLAGIYVFENPTYSNATLNVPQSSISTYQSANYWKNFTNIQGIDDVFKVDGIYYHSVNYSTATVIPNPEGEGYYQGDVVIPDSITNQDFQFRVTGIDNGAFDGCDELNSVVIGNAVETIGDEAFQGCTGLTSVTIGNGVTSIGQRAFSYCNALQTVTSLGTVPPVMANSNCFSSAAYRKATLKVHRNYIDTYTATNYWYKFENIEGYGSVGLGDANCDGEINIADATTLIDQLLGKNTGSEFYFESADLNGNGHLDIGDVTTLIDLLLWSH